MAFDNDELNKRREERQREKQFFDKQLRLLKIGVIMTAVTLVLCGAALLITQGIVSAPKPTQPSQPSIEVSTAPPETTEPAPTVPDTVIHFVAGGDINVTDKVVGAGAHTGSAIFGFIGEAEIFGCGARGDDEGVTLHGGVVVKFNDIGGFREADLCGNSRTDFHTETQRLISNVVHHVVGVNAFRIAREVLDFGGCCELASGLYTLVNDG